jgi:hypothetical protein
MNHDASRKTKLTSALKGWNVACLCSLVDDPISFTRMPERLLGPDSTEGLLTGRIDPSKTRTTEQSQCALPLLDDSGLHVICVY